MPVNDALGARMKEKYEMRARSYLTPGVPVAIRIDGKAFHTFTKGFKKPFDRVLMTSMQKTMQYLCQNIQGCVFGYTQSDEITLILIDYQTIDTDCWFGYQVQKVCSVAASMATMAFNKYFAENVANEVLEYRISMVPQCVEIQQEMKEYHDTLRTAVNKGAMFDARCFNIPKEEVTNLIYWRQLDATRNSIQMVGQANFSHKELQNKTCNMIQDMLHEQKGINWNDFPTVCKRGTACIKERIILDKNSEELYPYAAMLDEKSLYTRTEWVIDENMPILKGDDRSYVDVLVDF